MSKLAPLALCALMLAGCITYERTEFDPGVTPVSKEEAISMSAAGVPEEVLLHRVQAHGVAARPSPDDLVEMKNAGVPDGILSAMLVAPVTEPRPPQERRTVVTEVDGDAIFDLAFLAGAILGTQKVQVKHHHSKHCRH